MKGNLDFASPVGNGESSAANRSLTNSASTMAKHGQTGTSVLERACSKSILDSDLQHFLKARTLAKPNYPHNQPAVDSRIKPSNQDQTVGPGVTRGQVSPHEIPHFPHIGLRITRRRDSE
jgi:hypothetical protein